MVIWNHLQLSFYQTNLNPLYANTHLFESIYIFNIARIKQRTCTNKLNLKLYVYLYTSCLISINLLTILSTGSQTVVILIMSTISLQLLLSNQLNKQPPAISNQNWKCRDRIYRKTSGSAINRLPALFTWIFLVAWRQ